MENYLRKQEKKYSTGGTNEQIFFVLPANKAQSHNETCMDLLI